MVMAGALSAYSTPPPSLLAAYQAEPALAVHLSTYGQLCGSPSSRR